MVAAIAGVATVAGSAISANAAGDAAAGQQQASQQAQQLQAMQYAQNVALQAPAINTGNSARDRLSYLLGLSPTGYAGTTSVGGVGLPSSQPQTYDQYRQQLLSQYTKQVAAQADYSNDPNYQSLINSGMPAEQARALTAQNQAIDAQRGGINIGGNADIHSSLSGGLGNTSQVDEQGLDAAIKAAMASDQAKYQSQIDAAKNDPLYGSLAQQFQFNTFTPDTFSYTGQDLYNDPSYQFRLDQGQKAIDRQGAAAGRFLSGAQLQASSDYNQGAASQEFQNAYQRALGTFSTNENNKYQAFNTNEGNRFNAYQANFNNAVNPLLSLAGAATLGSQNLGSAGATAASQIGNTITGNANAQGAAGIAGANSLSSGISNAVQGYQSNQLLNNILNRNSAGSINNNPGTNVNVGNGSYSPDALALGGY